MWLTKKLLHTIFINIVLVIVTPIIMLILLEIGLRLFVNPLPRNHTEWRRSGILPYENTSYDIEKILSQNMTWEHLDNSRIIFPNDYSSK